MAEDIRTTGVVGLKGLKGLNQQPKEELPTLEQLQIINKSYSTGTVGPSPIDTSIQSYEEWSPMSSWGASKYDNAIVNSPMTSEELQDTRYENQPWLDVLANGVGKMLGTAGTTFVSSLVGMPYGLFEAANQGRWSAIWDNDITKGLADVDKWMEENMTNYRSQAQQNAAWYDPENLFSMNFVADDVIKNAGFTLGAAASMAVGAGSLGLMSRSLGFVNNISKGAKMSNAVLASLFSATGEGMIEAKQGVEERNKLELQKLEDSLAPEKAALEEEFRLVDAEYNATKGQSLVAGPDGNYYDPAAVKYANRLKELEGQRDAIKQKYEAGKQQIEESGLEMGNKVLLANQALLTAGNLIQFGKGMVKSFDKARHAAEVSSKAVKPTLVTAKKAADGTYRVAGKNLGRFAAATKGILTEGSEEMNQQWIQASSGASVNEADVNDYWKAKLDPESYRETTKGLYTLGNILDKGFNESWGDVNQWEQFVIGGLTGMAGSYTPTKLFNQDKTKGRLDPRRYGSWEGGAYNELRDFNQEYNQYQENIDDLNKILQSEDFPSRVSDMVGHTFMETKKAEYVNENDKKSWKDADDKQNIMDIQAFLRAGKLSDLRAIYDEMGSNLSDEAVQNIIKSTTKETTNPDGTKTYEGAYVDKDGNQIVSDDAIREEVKHNANELNRKLNSYLDSIDYVNRRTAGQLTKDQEDNLAYLHNMGKESDERMRKIMTGVRGQLPSEFLLKTSKTPEQLSKEYASSDLSFSKDENTKEGYVKVDTSLMNDSSFADFFQREIMRGGNINPEFAETAEEKALREEEDKNLSDSEKKTKARERASKKWKDAMQKMQEDANEQWSTNWSNLVDNFFENYKKNNNATLDETIEAFQRVSQDLQDAAKLYDQAGEFQKTLYEYMQNPSLVDRAKEKEETKVQKEEEKKQVKDKFVGKGAKQMKQELADGSLDMDEFDDFAGADLSDVTDEDVKAAQQEVRKAKEGIQKGSALKNHIQENLSDNPSQQEIEAAELAMKMVDQATLAADNPEDISIDMPELSQIPLDEIDPNASIDGIDDLNDTVQDILANAFNSLKEDEGAQEDIPEEVPTIDDVEDPETGDDPVTKVAPEVVAPKVQKPSKANPDIVPKSLLTEGALDTIMNEMSKLYERPATNGTWRSTTTRNVYGRSTGTYHEDIAKQQFGENSKEYKRSKAIWEYLNSVGAFDRQENASKDRVKTGDTIHFMVKYLPEVFGSRIEEVADEDKPYAMVILMLNENGEVLGDLPLVQLEPSYKAGNPTQQVKDLQSLQEKVFNAFYANHAKMGGNEAVVDSALEITDTPNLGLTFDSSKKPLVSKVKQVMKGVVPFRKSEINTLNAVTGEAPLELAIKVTAITAAIKKGDKKEHQEIKLPKVGNEGQPYILIPTASGEKIAVPFYTPTFNIEQHKGTELYKHLVNALYYMMRSYDNPKINLDNFNKHIDVIEGLLQVKRQEDAKRVIDITKDNVTLHLQSLTDPEQKINITVSNTNNPTEVAMALAEALSGIPINVSLNYLNDTIESGNQNVQGGMLRSDYNRVIGEIANVNLPQNTPHTVNSWFTVELAPSAGVKPTKKVTTKTTGIMTTTVNGKNIEVNTDSLIAYDPTTGEIIENDEDVNLLLAQIKANKPQYKGKDRIQITIQGKVRTYDVKENKFVKNPPIKKETTAQPESVEETPDVSNVIPPVSGAVSFAETKPQTQTKTLEQIEDEMKQKKVINRQSKDAWSIIPDSLKLKMFNEGTPIQLSYNNKSITISASNLGMMTKALQDANMAAKANNLTVSEAAKPMEKDGVTLSKEKEREARRWLAKNLPSLSSEERTQFVEKVSRMGDNAGKYWGSYRSGVIEIQRNAPMGTVYHEAFHYVMNMILSPEERKAFLNIAKEEYGISDNWAAEERLANDFRRYAMDENASGIIGKLKRWFRKISDKITRYNRISDATVNQLFWKINNGEFAQKFTEIENFEERQQEVLREIRNVQREKYSWNNLPAETRNNLKESGLSEEAYNNMSLEEKEQYVKCRG